MTYGTKRKRDHTRSCSTTCPCAAASVAPDLPAAIRGCVSGRELIDQGFAADVEIAVARDSSDTVPLLRSGAFTAA